MEINTTTLYHCIDNEKTQGISRIILLIVALFAYVKRFSFYIKPSSGYLICDAVSSELYLISFFKMKWTKMSGV